MHALQCACVDSQSLCQLGTVQFVQYVVSSCNIWAYAHAQQFLVPTLAETNPKLINAAAPSVSCLDKWNFVLAFHLNSTPLRILITVFCFHVCRTLERTDVLSVLNTTQ